VSARACGPYCCANGCRAHATSIVDSVALYRIIDTYCLFDIVLRARIFIMSNRYQWSLYFITTV